MDSAAGTRVGVSARSTPGLEFDAADGAGVHIGRHARCALRARERHLRDWGEAGAADAFARLLGNESTTRRTLIAAARQLHPTPPPSGERRLLGRLFELPVRLSACRSLTVPTGR